MQVKIIEYDPAFRLEAQNLLVELEEHLVRVDKDHLDIVGNDYREKMLVVDLQEIEQKNGKCFIAIVDDSVVGLIMGVEREYGAYDYLDYSCPHAGVITELVVKSEYQGQNIGNALTEKMERYFRCLGCKYSFVDVFAYNEPALRFYSKEGYHPRMITQIKKLFEEKKD